MHIFGQSEKGPCTSLSTWPKYLNVLIYANWGGLMVKTNFDSKEEVPLKLRKMGGGLLGMLRASSELEKLGRPNCIAWIRPRQWIVSSQPAVLRPTKARQAQRKCATAAHSLRRYPHHPPPHPIANPCALLEAQPCSALLRGDNNRRKRRSGGQRGPRGVAWRGGGAGNYRLIRPNHVYFRGYRGS